METKAIGHISIDTGYGWKRFPIAESCGTPYYAGRRL